MRLPRRIHLPFGYVVSIRLVTQRQMDDAGGEGCHGLWLVDKRVILILKRLSAARRRWMLYHELAHAVADAQHDCANKGLFRER